MDKSTLNITDQEFIEEYRSLNVFHRKIVCEACLRAFDQGNEQIKRSIGVEITYQYISLLEDAAMIFFALRDVKKHNGSFVKSLFKTFIKEDSIEYSTDALIKEVSRLLSFSFDDLLNELCLPSLERIKADLNLASKEISNIDISKSQYEKEITQTIDLIKAVVSNRKTGKDGEPFEFFKIGNKIKHGCMFLLSHKNDDAVFYPLTVRVRAKEKLNVIDGYYLISSKKKTLEIMIRNMNEIGKLISDLLLIFSKSEKS